jgi:hypothetical protein
MQVMLQEELTALKAQNAQQPEHIIPTFGAAGTQFSCFTSTTKSVQTYKY